MRGNRIKLLKNTVQVPFSDCVWLSRTWITITLWYTISAINLNSIPSLNFQPNMAKHKCNCFPSFKPYRVEMKKGEEKVFLILFYIHQEENRNLSSEVVLTF